MQKHIFRVILAGLAILSLNIGIARPAQATSLPVLVGIYSSSALLTTVGEINTIDSWLGAPTVTIAGTFIDLKYPSALIIAELNASWNAGYIPFVNLGAGTYPWNVNEPVTAAAIANGVLDVQIHNWANAYKTWSNNGQKRALIAPLQEMNGYWTSYGSDPANFKLAYYRIFQIFKEEGIQRDWVGWVFAPNGWNDPNVPLNQFENYYPGHSVVDAVGFSSFNFGSCPSGGHWDTYDQIYKPYLDRMAVMAPGKPIFIAEIGTVAEGGPFGVLLSDKNAWLSNTLTNLGAYPGLRGWVYFNRTEAASTLPNCQPYADYRVHQDKYGFSYNGFKDVVTKAPYDHWGVASPQINNIMFAPHDDTFEDVMTASAFSGLNSVWYADWVNRLFNAHITSGCRTDTIPLPGAVQDMTFQYYCPEDSVTRAQMAVFLERGIHGSSFTPPNVPPSYGDTVGHWAEDWIEALKSDGITSGCSASGYCPEGLTTRAEMAVFLLRSKHGASYTPPAATGTMFADVPSGYWAAKWVEQLAAEGITSGCAANLYCPDLPVTRAQMAVFLVRTFSLP